MSDICDRCQAKDSFFEEHVEGIVVCTNCGLVLEEKIIEEQYEKRTFETDNKEIQRVGPATRPEQANGDGTYLVNTKNGYTKIKIKYPQQTKEEEKKEKKIEKNCKRIYQLLSSAEVAPCLIDRVSDTYSELAKYNNLNVRNLNPTALALFYYVCRNQKIARSFKSIADMFPSVTERQIKKAFNDIKRDIVDYVDEGEDELISMEQNYISFYTGNDESKSDTKMLSFKIIKNINNNAVLEGKSPTTVAGLSLLLSYKLRNENYDDFKTFFSNFASKISLKRAFGQIKNELDKVIPNDYMKKIDELKLSMENFLK